MNLFEKYLLLQTHQLETIPLCIHKTYYVVLRRFLIKTKSEGTQKS